MSGFIIDVNAKTNDSVARELFTEMFKKGFMAHIQNYHGDMFIDYETFSKAFPEGIWIIRDSGTFFVPSTKFEKAVFGTSKYDFRERLKSTLTTAGTRMVRFFKITHGTEVTDNGYAFYGLKVVELPYFKKEDIDTIQMEYFCK